MFLFLNFNVYGQQEIKITTPTDSLYQSNIKKSKLYGVYIPRDIDDALSQLMKLTDADARNKLMTSDEETIARKLHFGLGRWMEYNWNFVEGSRFSHLLREKGLFHHDDMVQFMLITFHRHINKKPLDTELLVKKFKESRESKLKAERDKLKVISVEPKNSGNE